MSWTENKWLKPAWMGENNDFVNKYQDKFAKIGDKFAPKGAEGGGDIFEKEKEYGVFLKDINDSDFKTQLLQAGKDIDKYGSHNLLHELDRKAQKRKKKIYIEKGEAKLEPFAVKSQDEYVKDGIVPDIWYLFWNPYAYLEYQEHSKTKYLLPFAVLFHEIHHALFALEDFAAFFSAKATRDFDNEGLGDEGGVSSYRDKEERRVILEKEQAFVRKANKVLKKKLKYTPEQAENEEMNPMPIRKGWTGDYVVFNTWEQYEKAIKANLNL